MNKHPLTASQRITRDFSLLDTTRAERRYNLKKIAVYGDTIYISSQQDDWYIQKTSTTNIELYHRNQKKSLDEYHRETKEFAGVIEVLKYIQHHDKKVFALGHRGIYTKTKMERIYDKIENDKKIGRKKKKQYKRNKKKL